MVVFETKQPVIQSAQLRYKDKLVTFAIYNGKYIDLNPGYYSLLVFKDKNEKEVIGRFFEVKDELITVTY